MNKGTHFTGHPIIKQLLNILDPALITRTAARYQTDRYYKRFKTYDHLVTMLFAALSGVTSLRELTTVILACQGKINHLNMQHFPRRSTISDANRSRSSEVFGASTTGCWSVTARFYRTAASVVRPSTTSRSSIRPPSACSVIF